MIIITKKSKEINIKIAIQKMIVMVWTKFHKLLLKIILQNKLVVISKIKILVI